MNKIPFYKNREITSTYEGGNILNKNLNIFYLLALNKICTHIKIWLLIYDYIKLYILI